MDLTGHDGHEDGEEKTEADRDQDLAHGAAMTSGHEVDDGEDGNAGDDAERAAA